MDDSRYPKKEERFPNPILQTVRQKILLQEWLIHHKLPKVTIETVTVFTNHKTMIKSSSPNPRLGQQVIQLEQLSHLLIKTNEQLAEESFSKKAQLKFSNFLATYQAPPIVDILQRFQVNESE
ncbi:nuclease-related domain-containing protein [Bacillus sp. B190/17]|uniref:Nuclease-related domain-containing protein n=1 Tax=Bacillus lumedeiriae TaxID=3058829 RepID=A0ABW8IA59_9BACI